MNCEQAQTILIDSTVDQKSTTWIDATAHISQCEECQVQAQFERHLGAWLDTSVQPNADVWSRIETQTSDPALKLWMNPTTQKEKMKRNIITSSVAAATIMVGLGLISQSALAATPKAKFIAMKKAVFATVVRSGKTSVVVRGTSWFIVDGQLVELADDSFTFTPSDNVKAVSGHPIDPTKTTKPSPSKFGTKVVTGVPLKLDLNETHYDSIRFGKDQNELVLTQKGKKNSRYVVQLDKKTSAPTYLTLQKSEKGLWQLVKGKQVTFMVDYLPLK
jgi:hypothetical protein